MKVFKINSQEFKMNIKCEFLLIRNNLTTIENYFLVDMRSYKRNIMIPLKNITHWKIKQVRIESLSSRKYKCSTFKSVKKKNNLCNPIPKKKAHKICWLRNKVKLKTLRKSWIRKSKTVLKKYNKPILNIKNLIKSTFSSKLTAKKNWLFADREMNF